MFAALGLNNLVEPSAFRLFLDKLMRDAGDPQDPVERMLLEQLTLAHFRAAQLQSEAEGAKAVEAIELRERCSIALMAETRKMALALAEYRERSRSRPRHRRTSE
jgi:hypothetical protein